MQAHFVSSDSSDIVKEFIDNCAKW